MAFNVNYSFNNGTTTGTATFIGALKQAIYNFGRNNLTQCTLSGTAAGPLTTADNAGYNLGTDYGLSINIVN